MYSRRVLVADSDALARWPVAERLRSSGFAVVEARTAADALAHVVQGLDLAFIDETLAESDGHRVLSNVSRVDPDLTCVAFIRDDRSVAQPDPLRASAFEVMAKPVALDALGAVVARGVEVTRLRRELRAIRHAVRPPAAILGDSPAMQRVRALIERYATSAGSPVLVTGEAGTGKRLVARALHDAGVRAASPLLSIACAGTSAAAFERELFGAESAPSGPRTVGPFDAASDGTVVVTNVERLPAALQIRLLQVIEARTFRRAGGAFDVSTDARVVATSSIDLDERVRAGDFRGDLFYRLSALRVDLPPLRARREDVPTLTQTFAEEFAREWGRPAPVAVRTDGDTLNDYAWAGNVRELRNVIERAMLLGEYQTDGCLDLGAALARPHNSVTGGGRSAAFALPAGGVDLEDVERGFVAQALARTGGNQTKAAALLSIHRDQIRYRIEKFGLKS